ncbi:hypothetical protein [Caballeronia sp. ATUFL_M2_KS44]|uniref:hypothetical protein n=1 Tax=Caballeronia sp. ATUFL_M2_KS44 TaxID=2921767 RepID=UPI0020297E1E|nr:hypothetical protein [Caballeronia sp. ATUFL_M2_KS44]
MTIELNAQPTLTVASVAALLGAMAGAVVGRPASVLRSGVIVALGIVVIAGWIKSIIDI